MTVTVEKACEIINNLTEPRTHVTSPTSCLVPVDAIDYCLQLAKNRQVVCPVLKKLALRLSVSSEQNQIKDTATQ